MTRDDIIQVALEHFGAVLKPSDLEVQLAVLAVAAEREACAKVCEDLVLEHVGRADLTRNQCVNAIRARDAV